MPVPLADDQCSVVIAPPPNGRQRLQHQHPLYPRTTSTAGSSASFAAEVDDEADETDEATNLDTSLAALRVLTGRGVARLVGLATGGGFGAPPVGGWHRGRRASRAYLLPRVRIACRQATSRLGAESAHAARHLQRSAVRAGV